MCLIFFIFSAVYEMLIFSEAAEFYDLFKYTLYQFGFSRRHTFKLGFGKLLHADIFSGAAD